MGASFQFSVFSFQCSVFSVQCSVFGVLGGQGNGRAREWEGKGMGRAREWEGQGNGRETAVRDGAKGKRRRVAALQSVDITPLSAYKSTGAI